MASALARELRENLAYLREAGWHASAELMARSADELDRLECLVTELEAQAQKAPDWGSALARLRSRT